MLVSIALLTTKKTSQKEEDGEKRNECLEHRNAQTVFVLWSGVFTYLLEECENNN